MAQDIEIDLTAAPPSPRRQRQSTSPTMAETLYAQRLVEFGGIQDADPATITQGVKTAIGDIQQKNQTQVADISNERDLVNQILGQVQATQAIAKLSESFGVSKLAYVKESKTYRFLKGKTPNGSELSGTWEEFCGLLGMSVDKADADIANLRAFGEEALESMTRMGVGYRDLAQYRKLPDDHKTALIEAAKTGDKDQLLDLAETLIEKHVSEKNQLTAKIAALSDDLTAAGRRANNMDAEIERQEIIIERLSKQQRLTKFDPFTEDVRHESMHLHAGAELNLISLQTLFEKALNEAPAAERDLCVEQVYIAVCSAVSRGLLVIEAMRDMVEQLPDRIHGQHVLTPPEAERWALEYESLKNAHGAAEAARQIKRDADKPKGRGRPAGSKSKVE